MKKLTVLFVIALLAGCQKEADLLPGKSKAPKSQSSFTEGTPGILIIHDYSANGSVKENEFGNAEDWLELFNTTGNTLKLEEGKWFLTDDAAHNPAKFELPELTIEPYGKVIIWCDDMNTVEDDIHANFKLSSSGEKVGLFYFTGSDYSAIDICSFCTVKK